MDQYLDQGTNFNAIYLNFAKTFDSIPHERLLWKLEVYGIEGKMLGWIGNTLSNRRQRFVINGEIGVKSY